MPAFSEQPLATYDLNATDQSLVLIGRDAELATIERALKRCPIITITGQGGMGKTTLALRAYMDATGAGDFADACIIRLATVQTRDAFLLAVANALQLPLHSESAWIAQIKTHLQTRTALLLLDNFEQLLDCADDVAQLADAAPQLRVLVTSRERLGIPSEQVVHLEGISQTSSPTRLAAAEEVFLFYARRVQPSFAPNAIDRTHIQLICKLTNGLPLALELAAAWVSLLPVRFIADQIQTNLDWLSTSMGYTHQASRSVRAVLDYFWSLLSPEEQIWVQKLSVFSGGFDREMARKIAGTSLFFLLGLIDRSFLQRTSLGRFEMHELLKQYAANQLRQNGEQLRTVQAQHAKEFQSWVAAHVAETEGQDRAEWLARFDAEHDNLREALRWYLESALENARDANIACDMAARLSIFWLDRGHGVEGRGWLQKAIAAAETQINSNLINPALLAGALGKLCLLASAQGDYAEAKRVGERALAMHRALHDEEGIALTLHELAVNEGYVKNYTAAVQLFEEALVIDRQRGNAYGESVTLINIARMWHAQNKLDAASSLLIRATEIARNNNDDNIGGHAAAMLAMVHLDLGRESESLPALIQTLEFFRQTEDVIGALSALEATILVLAHQHIEPELAVRLLACDAYLSGQHRLTQDAHIQTRLDQAAKQLAEQLGASAFAQAQRQGQAMSLVNALEIAMDALRQI